MKLPKTKEQIQIAVLAAMIGGGALFAGLRFGLNPLLKNIKKTRNQLNSVQGEIDKYKQTLKAAAQIEGQNTQATNEIVAISKAHIPEPMFDNYEIVIRELVKKYGKAAGIVIENVAQTDPRDLPARAPARAAGDRAAPPAARGGRGGRGAPTSAARAGAPKFRLYRASVQTRCSYAQLKKFIRLVEEENPYMSVSSITAAGQATGFHQHRVDLILAWTIWVRQNGLAEFLSEQEKTGEPSEGASP
ncbi:MAG: hypothetical protein JXR37_11795 [Kiritimatiellae bacterium]|nr:hypothetical protein [Kiritimatiellia bacterium]